MVQPNFNAGEQQRGAGVAIIEGEFHWHKHDNDDEFFFVLDGQLLIDLEDKTITLNA